MHNTFYMAWRYMAYNRIKTIILVLSTALILFLPFGLRTLVARSAESLTRRAESTPLLIGAKGSPLELVLNSLYFESDIPEPITFAEVERVQQSGLADAVPLYNRFTARGFKVVGATPDYLHFRKLKPAAGRPMAVLGECMLGAAVAERLDVEVGGSVITSPESVFDLAGVYPLKMNVVGVLEPTGTPDDRVILTDIKTAWIIEGLAHGHQDLAQPDAVNSVLKREGNVVVANASVMQYNEITPDNMDSFHFHGDPAGFPLTAVLALPHDEKSATLLQGKYLDAAERMQIVRPETVMDELLDTVLTVQKYIVAGTLVVGLSTLMTAVLVFLLSLRLRKGEMETMHRIGGDRLHIAGLVGAEVLAVLLAGTVLAGMLIVFISRLGDQLIRWIIL
jgi:putative ABC transport system permease protein